jgi:GNAT superfamily N-acetyltransferase
MRLLRPSDIPGAMRLKEAANWNQTEQDWERLLQLEPEGCFGLEQDGVLAASATAFAFGRELAWIGMVLTLPEFRNRGLAGRLMEQTLQFCTSRRVAWVGLDATDMGLPIYRRFGFEADSIVERWERPADAELVAPGSISPWEPMPELDVAACGTDRARLLASLAFEEAASVPDAGYGMGRAGSKAAYFGPCVAKSAAAADDLLRWFLARHLQERIYWDVLADNRDAVALARKYKFQPVRKLTRMIRKLRPDADVLRWKNAMVFAIAGFEYG